MGTGDDAPESGALFYNCNENCIICGRCGGERNPAYEFCTHCGGTPGYDAPPSRQKKKPKPLKAADAPLPKRYDNERFRQAWLGWLHYRGQVLRKPWKYQTAALNLRQWDERGYSPAKVIDGIERSILNQWQGVHVNERFVEPKYARRPGETGDQADHRLRQLKREEEEELRARQEHESRVAALRLLSPDHLTVLHAEVVKAADGFMARKLAQADPLADRMLVNLMWARLEGGKS